MNFHTNALDRGEQVQYWPWRSALEHPETAPPEPSTEAEVTTFQTPIAEGVGTFRHAVNAIQEQQQLDTLLRDTLGPVRPAQVDEARKYHMLREHAAGRLRKHMPVEDYRQFMFTNVSHQDYEAFLRTLTCGYSRAEEQQSRHMAAVHDDIPVAAAQAAVSRRSHSILPFHLRTGER